ncbi:hypothetical protein [Streptomyces sp. NPDC047453]|uniref:hypothetical protein n=1 Tax=Streptomyces sp. NPDC047453 TaxID=3154812 RepID=UPI0033F0FA95
MTITDAIHQAPTPRTVSAPLGPPTCATCPCTAPRSTTLPEPWNPALTRRDSWAISMLASRNFRSEGAERVRQQADEPSCKIEADISHRLSTSTLTLGNHRI